MTLADASHTLELVQLKDFSGSVYIPQALTTHCSSESESILQQKCSGMCSESKSPCHMDVSASRLQNIGRHCPLPLSSRGHVGSNGLGCACVACCLTRRVNAVSPMALSLRLWTCSAILASDSRC